MYENFITLLTGFQFSISFVKHSLILSPLTQDWKTVNNLCEKLGGGTFINTVGDKLRATRAAFQYLAQKQQRDLSYSQLTDGKCGCSRSCWSCHRASGAHQHVMWAQRGFIPQHGLYKQIQSVVALNAHKAIIVHHIWLWQYGRGLTAILRKVVTLICS